MRDFDRETEIWYNNQEQICDLINDLDKDIKKFGPKIINWIANKI